MWTSGRRLGNSRGLRSLGDLNGPSLVGLRVRLSVLKDWLPEVSGCAVSYGCVRRLRTSKDLTSDGREKSEVHRHEWQCHDGETRRQSSRATIRG
jgi:hypothetical protein